MEMKESNFFSTQIPISQRYQNTNNENTISCDLSVEKKNPSIRIRQAKSQARKVSSLYKQALKQYLRTKNSVEKHTSKTHKIREQFIKLYSNKKNKYLNKSMMENKKHMDEEMQLQATNRVRTLKLSKDLGLLYTKNQCEEQNLRVKQENKKQAEDLRKQIKVIKKQELDEAKQKFLNVKRGQTQFLIRKKNMSAMVSSRAHHNYLLKVHNQMQMLQSYTKLLEKVNDLKEVGLFNKQEGDSFNKTFFVTTKNTFN